LKLTREEILLKYNKIKEDINEDLLEKDSKFIKYFKEKWL